MRWLKDDPEKKTISLYDIHGFTYADLLVEGLKRSGKDLSVEGFVKALEGIRNWDNGAQAPLTFEPDNRQGVTKVIVLRGVQEGKNSIGRWEIIRPWTEARKQ